MLKTIAVIAAGGALGSVLRHMVNTGALKLAGPDFPWGTLTVNIAGSFAIGLLAAVFAHFWQPAQELRLFLVTGLLGGFTTFSAFSLDAALLWERGAPGLAMAYILASVCLSVAALFAAMLIVRSFAS